MLHERENIDLFCCPKTHFVKNDRKGGGGIHTKQMTEVNQCQWHLENWKIHDLEKLMNYQENYYYRTLDDLGIRDQNQIFVWLHQSAWGILVLQPGIKLRSLHWKYSLSNWTTRKLSSPSVFLKVGMEERLMTEECLKISKEQLDL